MSKPSTTPDTLLQEFIRARFEQAVCDSDLSAVQSLLADGCLASVPQPHRASAMRLAITKGTAHTVQLLLRAGCSPNEPTQTKESPAYWAAQANKPDVLRDLLQAGANPNGPPGKCAPIESAALSGNLVILDILLESGANPKHVDEDGQSLLHYAATFDHIPFAQRLLELEISIDSRDKEGLTPLHRAAGYGAMKAVQFLVQQGADVHARCNEGLTTALTAAFHGRTEIFAEVVASGADPLARDPEGRGAFELVLGAQKSRDHAAVWMLENFPDLLPPSEELDEHLVGAVRRGHTGLVKKLAELGADIGQKPGGRTLLQCAPAKAEDLKRLLRSLKSGSLIASAMGASERPSAPPANTPSPL